MSWFSPTAVSKSKVRTISTASFGLLGRPGCSGPPATSRSTRCWRSTSATATQGFCQGCGRSLRTEQGCSFAKGAAPGGTQSIQSHIQAKPNSTQFPKHNHGRPATQHGPKSIRSAPGGTQRIHSHIKPNQTAHNSPNTIMEGQQRKTWPKKHKKSTVLLLLLRCSCCYHLRQTCSV